MSDYDWGSGCCADAAVLAMLTAPAQSPAPSLDPCGDGAGLTYHVDLGATWLTRDDQQVRVDRADIPALVAWLLVAEDRLSDAA